MSDARRWAPSAVWGMVILIATSIPGSAIPEGPSIPGIDKVVHGLLYGVLGWVVGRALTEGRGRRAWQVWGRAVVVMTGLAAADEWHQQWIPGRGADALDWVADVAGVTLGASLSRAAQVRRETRS